MRRAGFVVAVAAVAGALVGGDPAGATATSPPLGQEPPLEQEPELEQETALPAAPSVVPGRLASEISPEQLELARARAVELHAARIGLTLDLCRAADKLGVEAVARLRAALPGALAAFVTARIDTTPRGPEVAFDLVDLDQGVVAVGEVEPVQKQPEVVEEAVAEDEVLVLGLSVQLSSDGPEIAHTTLTEWLGSEAWRTLAATELGPEGAATLAEELARPRRAVEAALATAVEARLARGLCLTPAERDAIRPSVTAFAASRVTEINAERFRLDAKTLEGEDLADLGAKALGFGDALAAPRRAVFKRLRSLTREPFDDLACEVEHLIALHGAGDRERELLLGFARTLVERSVVRKKALPGRGLLAPVSDLAQADLWTKGVRGVLGLPDDAELDSLPSRDPAPVREARVELLLAALDEAAGLTEDQRGRARELLRKFVAVEFDDRNSPTFNQLGVPAWLDLRRDGTLRFGAPVDPPGVPALETHAAELRALLTPRQIEVTFR